MRMHSPTNVSRSVNDDAMVWLDKAPSPYDIVLIDFPDPNNFSLGKLYTSRFYRLVRRAMHEDSVLVVQSTSPVYARKSFWCIDATLRESGFYTHPFHASVPSFGEWGYVLAKPKAFDAPTALAKSDLRYLNDAMLKGMFVFANDMSRVATRINRLNNQHLVEYYESEWQRFQ